MMRCVYVTEHTGTGKLLEKLKIGDLPLPQVKPHEVLVRVHAASLNIDDLHMAQGTFAGGLSVVQTRRPTAEKPVVLGSDFAGVVEEVGEKVKGIAKGDRVCGLQQQPFGHMGSWSTHTVTPASNLVPVPEGCSFEQAAALVMPLYVSTGIIAKCKVREGMRVLVIGASGGIGSVCVQMLRAAATDIHIAGVCSGRNVDFVKGLGAQEVVDYTKGRPEEQLREKPKFDVVIDLLGGPDSFATGKALLKPRSGRFVTSTGPIAWLGERKLGAWETCSWCASLVFHTCANFVPGKHPYYILVVPTALEKDSLQRAIDSRVTAQVTDTVALEEGPIWAAIKKVQSHRVTGKVVIMM